MPRDMSLSKMNEEIFDINDQILSLRESARKVQLLVDENTDSEDDVS